MRKILGVIPARYGSTRFEGKPLELIEGRTMINWVYARAKESNVDELVVATDDDRIYDEVISFGGKAILTLKKHENGTSRIVEVINKEDYLEYDFIINIQGDEPLIDKNSINLIIEEYKKNNSEIITLKKEIKDKHELDSPNVVKVVTNFQNDALYFSRYPIPYERNNLEDFKYYKHIGIYGYTNKFLNKLNSLKDGILEKIESLEQLKFLENGYTIKVLETFSDIFGVDTVEDLENVIKHIKQNNIKL